jgi:hypothetical protein
VSANESGKLLSARPYLIPAYAAALEMPEYQLRAAIPRLAAPPDYSAKPHRSTLLFTAQFLERLADQVESHRGTGAAVSLAEIRHEAQRLVLRADEVAE